MEAQADALKNICPKDVFDIEDIGGVRRAVVARPRSCSVCRACIEEDNFRLKIKLRRIRDHFICVSVFFVG